MMWKSEHFVVQGEQLPDRTVLSSLYCTICDKLHTSFQSHFGLFRTFEASCPGCGTSQTFTPHEVVKEDDE